MRTPFNRPTSIIPFSSAEGHKTTGVHYDCPPLPKDEVPKHRREQGGGGWKLEERKVRQVNSRACLCVQERDKGDDKG